MVALSIHDDQMSFKLVLSGDLDWYNRIDTPGHLINRTFNYVYYTKAWGP